MAKIKTQSAGANPCQDYSLHDCDPVAECDSEQPGYFQCKCPAGYADISPDRARQPGRKCQRGRLILVGWLLFWLASNGKSKNFISADTPKSIFRRDLEQIQPTANSTSHIPVLASFDLSPLTSLLPCPHFAVLPCLLLLISQPFLSASHRKPASPAPSQKDVLPPPLFPLPASGTKRALARRSAPDFALA
jgi:hypothetical protein